MRKPHDSNLRREAKTSRDQGTMTMKLGDSDKDVGGTVYEFYDRRISN